MMTWIRLTALREQALRCAHPTHVFLPSCWAENLNTRQELDRANLMNALKTRVPTKRCFSPPAQFQERLLKVMAAQLASSSGSRAPGCRREAQERVGQGLRPACWSPQRSVCMHGGGGWGGAWGRLFLRPPRGKGTLAERCVEAPARWARCSVKERSALPGWQPVPVHQPPLTAHPGPWRLSHGHPGASAPSRCLGCAFPPSRVPAGLHRSLSPSSGGGAAGPSPAQEGERLVEQAAWALPGLGDLAPTHGPGA